MRADSLSVGSTVFWGNNQSGTVLGWVKPRQDDKPRGRNALVLIRVSGAPDLSFLWDREGRYTRKVPVKALRTDPPVMAPVAAPIYGVVRAGYGLDTTRRRKAIATAEAIAAEVTMLIDRLRCRRSTVGVTVEDGGRKMTIHLSASDATAVAWALRHAREGTETEPQEVEA